MKKSGLSPDKAPQDEAAQEQTPFSEAQDPGATARIDATVDLAIDEVERYLDRALAGAGVAKNRRILSNYTYDKEGSAYLGYLKDGTPFAVSKTGVKLGDPSS